MTLKVRDGVTILSNTGRTMGAGIIVSINDFREPGAKYAVAADFYKEDYLFVGEENLVKIQEES